MFQQKEFPSNSSPIAPTLDIVLQSVRSLLTPQTALYYACNRERIERRAVQLAALDLELESLRKRAFVAGARLTALHQQAHGEGVAP